MYQMETFLYILNLRPLNKGQNGQKTMGPKHVRYSEIPLYQKRIFYDRNIVLAN